MDPVTVSILVAIFDGVMKAIPEAVSAFSSLKQMTSENRDPTADEWKQIATAMAAIHNQVQAAS